MKTNVIRKNGKLWLECDGKPLLPAAYMSYLQDRADYSSFRRAGYRLFCVCVNMGDTTINPNSGVLPFSPHVWKGRGEYDFSPVYHSLNKLAADSDGDFFVILRVNLDPPQWWLDDYPEERLVYGDGKTGKQSVFSTRWLDDAKLFLDKLYAYLKSCVYFDNVVGIHLAAMHTEEWIAPSTPTGRYDYSENAKKAFGAYLYGRYGVSEVEIPTQEQLDERAFIGVKGCETVDLTKEYLRFFNEGFAGAVKTLAAHAKRLCDREWAVGAFCGYLAQLGCERGHSAFSLLLDDPNVDFFASPFAYVDGRQTAADWFYHGAMDTCARRDKLWFLEADVRTHKTAPLYETNPELMDGERTVAYFKNPVFSGPKTEAESLSVILRSFAKALISGNAFWWFDMWGGWYASSAIMQSMEKMRAVYETEWNALSQRTDEIAVILDEKASYSTAGKAFWNASYRQMTQLGFVGAPYALYLKGDLSNEEISGCKLCLYILGDGSKNVLTAGGERLEKEGAFTASELVSALQKAGGHIYSQGNIVYANSRFLALTATSDGEICLSMPKACKLKAFTDGKEYCGKEFSFPMTKNQTELFEVTE